MLAFCLNKESTFFHSFHYRIKSMAFSLFVFFFFFWCFALRTAAMVLRVLGSINQCICQSKGENVTMLVCETSFPSSARTGRSVGRSLPE